MSFMKSLINELKNELVPTENGALGYKTTSSALLDLNFSVATMRSKNDENIAKAFVRALAEDPRLAIKWLFFARDIRGGLGERRLFRVCIRALALLRAEVVEPLIPLISEYGRFDDLLCLLDTPVKGEVLAFIEKQLHEDKCALSSGKSISLLCKWLPSENTSSHKTRAYAKIVRAYLGMTSEEYRKLLSNMRGYIDVVERKMSAKKWDKINYESVPSRASLIYHYAFMRNDEERYCEFLDALERGEAKINADTLFPHDVVHRYMSSYRYGFSLKIDPAIEALWKALPDFVNGNEGTLVVADGSGSMYGGVGNTNVSALSVANALAIYLAERASGDFKDKYITFSASPQLVDLGKGKTLCDKLSIALEHCEVANTNIKAVFDLVLKTAINGHLAEQDMPKTVLILSDMEFDNAVEKAPNKALFEMISDKFAQAGYDMPRLVFWNLNSRSMAIPLRENKLGVALVSGFSPTIVNMVLSGELDPYKCLVDILNGERYRAVDIALGE